MVSNGNWCYLAEPQTVQWRRFYLLYYPMPHQRAMFKNNVKFESPQQISEKRNIDGVLNAPEHAELTKKGYLEGVTEIGELGGNEKKKKLAYRVCVI